MNRRGFFKSLALIGAAVSASPHIFIPKFEPVKWKIIAPPKFGYFIAEFKYAISPLHTEFKELFFHQTDRPITPETALAAQDITAINTDWESKSFTVSGYGDEGFVKGFARDDKWKISFPLETAGQAV